MPAWEQLWRLLTPTARTGGRSREAASMTDAYTAYSYLIAGQDFGSFELAPEFGRVPPYAAGLTAGQEQRAQRLLRDSLVVSLHDHPVRFPLRMEETPSTTAPGASTPPTRAWRRPG